MSNTQAFLSIDNTKCMSPSSDIYDSVGSLSKAQAMDCFFNIESVGLTFSANATWYEIANPSNTKTINETGIYELYPFSLSGNFFSGGTVSYSGTSSVYHNNHTSPTSTPDRIEPYYRICLVDSNPQLMDCSVDKTDGSLCS